MDYSCLDCTEKRIRRNSMSNDMNWMHEVRVVVHLRYLMRVPTWTDCTDRSLNKKGCDEETIMKRKRILYQVHHFLAFAERVGDVCWQDPFLDREGNVWSCRRTSPCLRTWKSFLQVVEFVIDPIRSRIVRLWSRLSILIRTKEKCMYRGSIRTE